MECLKELPWPILFFFYVSKVYLKLLTTTYQIHTDIYEAVKRVKDCITDARAWLVYQKLYMSQ